MRESSCSKTNSWSCGPVVGVSLVRDRRGCVVEAACCFLFEKIKRRADGVSALRKKNAEKQRLSRWKEQRKINGVNSSLVGERGDCCGEVIVGRSDSQQRSGQ